MVWFHEDIRHLLEENMIGFISKNSNHFIFVSSSGVIDKRFIYYFCLHKEVRFKLL
jgi:hypothetical protein